MSCLAGGSHSTHRSTIHHHSLASDMYCLIRSFTITRQYTLAFRVSFCIASQGDLQSPGNTPLLSELPFVLPHRAIYNHQAIHPCFQSPLLYCLTGSFTIIRQYTLLSEFPFVLPHRAIYNHQAIHSRLGWPRRGAWLFHFRETRLNLHNWVRLQRSAAFLSTKRGRLYEPPSGFFMRRSDASHRRYRLLWVETQNRPAIS